jgi:hypothetical protein
MLLTRTIKAEFNANTVTYRQATPCRRLDGNEETWRTITCHQLHKMRMKGFNDVYYS